MPKKIKGNKNVLKVKPMNTIFIRKIDNYKNRTCSFLISVLKISLLDSFNYWIINWYEFFLCMIKERVIFHTKIKLD